MKSHSICGKRVFTQEYPLLSATVREYLVKCFDMPVTRCCVKSYKTKEFENAMHDRYCPDCCKLPVYMDIGNNGMVYICHNL